MYQVTLSWGMLALFFWGMVVFRASKSPLTWTSPSGLLGMGMITFLIFPAVYWQIRPWNFGVPPYQESLHLVMIGSAILAIPFVIHGLFSWGGSGSSKKVVVNRPEFGIGLWLFFVPIIVGMAWQAYLITLGHQARLDRIDPSLGFTTIFSNIAHYYPACYFALYAFGNKAQRRASILIWILDVCLQIYSLHRYFVLLILLRSFVFASLNTGRLKFRSFVLGGVSIMLVITVIGVIAQVARQQVVGGTRRYLTPMQAAGLLASTGYSFLSGKLQHGDSNVAQESLIVKSMDATVYRLFDSRSASAIMGGVPDIIPYMYFEPYRQILYVVIPRYFWPDKPIVSKINFLTQDVMLGDSGMNPVTLLGEFYISFGFYGIFFGSFALFGCCRLVERILLKRGGIGPTLLVAYPVVYADLFFAVNDFLTRKITEGFRGLLVVALLGIIFRVARKSRLERPRRVPIPAASSPLTEMK